jgi:hypothetical protein
MQQSEAFWNPSQLKEDGEFQLELREWMGDGMDQHCRIWHMAQGRAACQINRVHLVMHRGGNMALDQNVDLCLLTPNVQGTKGIWQKVSRSTTQGWQQEDWLLMSDRD